MKSKRCLVRVVFEKESCPLITAQCTASKIQIQCMRNSLIAPAQAFKKRKMHDGHRLGNSSF